MRSGAKTDTAVRTDVKCTWCDYDLREHAAHDKCPECGTPVLLSLEDTAPLVRRPDPPVNVASETACVRCGEGLQSRRSDDTCSGCGVPAWFSIYGNWLRASDLGWLERVRRGVVLCFWSSLVMLFANVLGFVLPMLFWSSESAEVLWAERAVRIGIGLIALLLETAGVLCVTSREPALRSPEAPFTLRRTLRHLVLAYAAYYLLTRFLILIGFPVVEVLLWRWTLGLLAPLAAMALTVALIAYLLRLAPRIPDRRLRRNTATLFWVACFAHLALFLLDHAVGLVFSMPDTFIFYFTATGAIQDWFHRLLLLCYAPVCVAQLVVIIWLAVILIRYKRALSRAIACVTKETGTAAQPGGNLR